MKELTLGKFLNPTSVIIKSQIEGTTDDFRYFKKRKICKIDNVSGKKVWEYQIKDSSNFSNYALDEDRLYYQDNDSIKCYLLLGL